MQLKNIKTKGEATQYAIEWKRWASEQNLSYGDLAEWQAVFTELAEKFDIEEEFRENGII